MYPESGADGQICELVDILEILNEMGLCNQDF